MSSLLQVEFLFMLQLKKHGINLICFIIILFEISQY
ncbi:unnamed protein product [Paramecium pentaurelia]|uniref:Uncharacterized protein n=1 Tax=Paramecium pentaurelia TaxID=43138 RepID=A0A8S1YH82_9CILI|nr:unnamed protein product [Paramecium pentaurelia]